MATPAANTIGLTGNTYIDGLTQGSSWQFGGGAHVLTYSLNINDTGGNVPLGGQWSATLTSNINQALAAWSAVANLTFVYDAASSGKVFAQSNADIAITLTGNELGQINAYGLGVFPDPGFATTLENSLNYNRSTYPRPEGDIFIDNYSLVFNADASASAGLHVMLHELGHALGLKHTFDHGTPDNTGGHPILADGSYSIMSQGLGADSGPRLYDILAIQSIYGANMSYHTGDDYYATDGLYNPGMTIWDAGGNDTLDMHTSVIASGFTIDLRPGGISGNVAIAFGVTIENAVGNFSTNTFFGNDANNVLDGRGGSDVFTGGKGDDTYIVYSGSETITELANEGVDTVQSSAPFFTLPNNVEQLVLTGSAAISGTGNALDNLMHGNSAASTLIGKAGNDTYIVLNSGTVITENAGEGTDQVITNVSYTLPANVENLTLSGGAAIDGTGNAQANTITGNNNVNTLDGGGGADTMMGGQGDDNYVVDDPGDTPTEAANEGADTVMSSITYSIAALANIENLMLTGAGNVNATGNSLANTLTGNAGTNVLAGGLGNDLYVVGTGDSTVEAANEGTDTVQSAFSWTLAANVENLTLTGSGNLTGTGNALDNLILTNSGTTTLAGGAGNDTYGVFNNTTTVTENGGEGTDTIGSTVSFTLPANVEKLFLFGTAPISATGNAGDNEIRGNFGHNDLFGGGGNDSFDGGSGRDTLHLALNRADYTIANSGDMRTFTGGGVTETVHGVEKVAFADGVLTLRDMVMHFDDANGDGKADLLWRNLDGSAAIWNLNGLSVVGGGVIGANTPLEWSIAGTGDFNGDGREDLVWRNADGSVALWHLSGSALLNGGIVAASAPLDWTITGTGDFNGDGKDDLLFHHTDGSVAIWLMNGTSLVGGAVAGSAPTSWTIAGTGDFNGDMKDDIVWRNTDGSVAVWLMNGLSVAGGAVVGPPVPNDWRLYGTGDFNGDGKDDLLWRNNDGSVAVWLMNGVNSVGGGYVGPMNLPSEWTIAGTGDFNGDRKDDIAFLNDNGQVALWFLNGSSLLGGGIVGSAPTDWTIV